MLEVKNLTKRYGNHTAVSNLSFKIESGHVYGFLGPNGAGKSTTMNIVTGCLAATSGEVDAATIMLTFAAQMKERYGFEATEINIGGGMGVRYLPEHPPLYPEMTTYEYLRFVAEAKGVARKDIKRQLDYVIDVTSLHEMVNRQTQYLSKGYKQRVGIAQALLGEPQLVILDEPTVGLDPRQILEIRDLIKQLGKTHTVILSSHILSEIRAVCDSAIIIAKGELIAHDTLANLEKMYAGDVTQVIRVRAGELDIRRILAEVEGVNEFTVSPVPGGLHEVEIKVEEQYRNTLAESLFNAFAAAGKPIVHMSDNQATPEDVFLELTAQADVAEEEPENLPTDNEQEAAK